MRAPNASILIVDDEFSVRDSLMHWFRKDGYRVEAAENAAAALKLLGSAAFDVALVDIKMPGMDGIELQNRIHALDPRIAVIIITAFATVETAVQALKQGAYDYVTKPVDPDELSHVVARAVRQRQLEDENTQLRDTIDEMSQVDAIVGQSAAMRRVIELVKTVAPTDATVLIRGESGTGKELIARAIHAYSRRRYAPLVPVSCGAFPESLLESELFGHERGAFTGAQYQRKGKLELSDGGTLFLDEVGTIATRTQVELLRVLETHEFTRVGGQKSIKVDFRVVSATNEDLEKAVAEGRFREDLYYRLNVFSIEAPPLRTRREDIPLLAEHFRRKLSLEMDKRIGAISPAAMECLMMHDWPGNVRELANAIERAMVVGRPPAIRPEDLPVVPRRNSVSGSETLADVERAHIAAVLVRHDWNISHAAEALGIDRSTLYAKIKRFELRR